MKGFFQLLEQHLEARPGSCVCFHHGSCYVNLGRLFSLPVLVSLQSLVSLAGKPMSGLLAVQRSPKSKRYQIFVKTAVIRSALFAATLIFPSKCPFTLNQGVCYTLLHWDHFFSGCGEQLKLRSACGTSRGILLE